MHELFVDIGRKKYDNVSMDFLSMGMSGDFEDAIAAGANMVRVGSSIFGARTIPGTERRPPHLKREHSGNTAAAGR